MFTQLITFDCLLPGWHIILIVLFNIITWSFFEAINFEQVLKDSAALKSRKVWF